MPLPSVEQFIGTNVTKQGFKDAQKQLVEYVGNEVTKKVDTDAAFATKANKATTLAGYGIADAYTKAQVDSSIAAYVGGRKAYTTLALAQAAQSSLPANTAIEVTNDGANNGTYQWNGTTLTKSAYDPLTQAKGYADQISLETSNRIAEEKISETIVVTPSKVLQVFSDANGDVYAYFDESGHIHVTDLPESIQNEIINIKLKTDSILIKSDSDLYHFIDLEGNLVGKIDKDGQLYLTGLSNSVQNYLLNIGINALPVSSPKTYKTKADLYTPEVMTALQSNAIKAPIGRGLLQQQYFLGKEWLKNLSAPVSSNRIVIGAYNDKGDKSNWVADSGVVHPNIIQFDEPVCGFKYWMGINPYTNTNENFELPYIYGSNSDNLNSWTLIPDFPQPFDVDPPDTGGVLSGHLSDSFFTYDPINAELWFCWRQTRYYSADRNRANATNTFVGRKTKDGVNWSSIIIIYPTYTINDDSKLSPAILYNSTDGLFYLYYINLNGSMSCEVTEDLNHPNWRKFSDFQLPFTAWHLEMKWLGSSIVALIHGDTIDQLFVGVSTDMKNFEWSQGIFNAATNLYKSSFIPVFNDNKQVSLKIVYTTDQNSTPKWQLHTTQTNFTNIEA